MRRSFGIFILGELLLLNCLTNGAGLSSVKMYDDLPWPHQRLDQTPDQQQHQEQYRRETLREFSHPINSIDTFYLPEETAYDDVHNIDSTIDDSSEESLNRNDRSLMHEYRNLCETVTRKVDLTNDPNYEFQPPHYHEVFCKSSSLMADEPQKPSAIKKCAHPSFHCVQRSRTLFLVRRRWEGECWEPVTKVVASGCDCMWPVSTLGDVSIHY